MEQKTDTTYNSFSLIRFIWKWKFPLIIICLVTALLSFVFSTSLFIKPRFRSTAIVYAPRTNSIAKILMNEQNYNERLDIKAYAVEEETEQMMQILNSRDIQDALIMKYDLGNHYELYPGAKYYYTRLYKALSNNIKIKRTEFGAISISVTDSDPVLAADMANEIVRQLDTIKNKIEKERATAAYNLLKQQLDDVTRELNQVDDSLKVIFEHGVFDFSSQSERVMQQYAIAVAQGNTAATNRLQAELEKLAIWGAKSESLRGSQNRFREYQTMCRAKMMDAKVDMETKMPMKFVIEDAIPADKKIYPKKSVIMTVSTASMFILAVIILLIIENLNAGKKEPTVNLKEEKE